MDLIKIEHDVDAHRCIYVLFKFLCDDDRKKTFCLQDHKAAARSHR